MIISFYSYKGGVGRTQLTANIATFLCHYSYKKVLLIDWDLEAPGLHFYFGEGNTQNKGVVELLGAFQEVAKSKWELDETDLPYFDESYIVNIDNQVKGKGKIDLITAGFYDENYKEYNQKVTFFNWQHFYEKLDGLNYTEFLKRKIKELGYDYVLIDSRTGLSDYLGTVNIQLPDLNVLVMAPTNQNIEGCKRVAENIKKSPYIDNKYRKPLIMPILSRVDTSIEKETINWRKTFAERFEEEIQYFCQEARVDAYDYVSNTVLAYKRDISFGENIVFPKDQFEIERGTIAEKYQYIIQMIEAYSTQIKKVANNPDRLEAIQELKYIVLNMLREGEILEYFKTMEKIPNLKEKRALFEGLKIEYIRGANVYDFIQKLSMLTNMIFDDIEEETNPTPNNKKQ